MTKSSYYHDCEAIFLRYGGRPHWGKVHYLNKAQVAQAHPRYEDWWQQRDAIDPHGVFLNSYLRELRPQ